MVYFIQPGETCFGFSLLKVGAYTMSDDSRQTKFTASVAREGEWYVAQCLEVDVASQGATQEEAIVNLREALELHFEERVA